MCPFSSVLQASKALSHIYEEAYTLKPMKVSAPKLNKTPGYDFLDYSATHARAVTDEGTSMDVVIDTGAQCSLMSRSTYMEHFCDLELYCLEMPVANGRVQDMIRTTSWVHVELKLVGHDGRMIAISGAFHIVEGCRRPSNLVIGVDLLKPAKARIEFDVDNKGTDLMWLGDSYAILRTFSTPEDERRLFRTLEVYRTEKRGGEKELRRAYRLNV